MHVNSHMLGTRAQHHTAHNACAVASITPHIPHTHASRRYTKQAHLYTKGVCKSARAHTHVWARAAEAEETKTPRARFATAARCNRPWLQSPLPCWPSCPAERQSGLQRCHVCALVHTHACAHLRVCAGVSAASYTLVCVRARACVLAYGHFEMGISRRSSVSLQACSEKGAS